MIRERLVEIARSFVGCNAGPKSLERYRDLVGPGESPAMRHAATTALNPQTHLPGMSGCALVIRGFWRLAGLEHKRLAAPYRNGKAVEDLIAIGREAGAFVTDVVTKRPNPGDVVLVGGTPGETEHVFTVASCDGDKLTSIDGGQRVWNASPQERWETIAEKVRTWTNVRGIVFDSARGANDPGGGSRRRVHGWVDVSRLPFPVVDEPCPPTPVNHGGHELPRRPTLRRGAKGPDVVDLQLALGIESDGIFGPSTEATVRGAQARLGLDVDGVVGPRTWAGLGI